MAAFIGPVTGELESLLASLGGGGATGLLGRVAASALGGVAATELIHALTGASPAAKAKVPRYALVDLHTDTVIVTMGTRRAYRFLIRPRRRANRTKIIREIEVHRDGHDRV